jgi:hypothetical protein
VGSSGASGGGGGDPSMGGDLTGTASNAQLAAGSVSATELAAGSLTAADAAADLATQAELDTLSGDVDTALAALDVVDADLQAQMFTVVDNTQTASYQLVIGDAGKQVSMNVAGANDLTVPANATVAFPVNTVIHVYQYGAGTTTIVAAGGVTIRSFGPSLVSGGQYALMTLRKRATNEWELSGLTA